MKIDFFQPSLCLIGRIVKDVILALSLPDQTGHQHTLWRNGCITIHIVDSVPPTGVATREDLERAPSIFGV